MIFILKNLVLDKKGRNMKSLILLIFGLALIGCVQEQSEKDFLNEKESPKYQTETFAVVWKTVSMRKEKLEEIIPAQTKQLQELWDKGIVENVYFKTDEKFGKDETWPNIMFFLKAKNKEAAIEQLEKMEFVKHKLSTYELHPVGLLWLTQNEKTLEKVQKSKRTFGVVWTSGASKKPADKDIILQSEGFQDLWNEGFIENAYFDIVGSGTGNRDRPTMVNFVNAANEEEVNKILKDLHFIKNETSTYMLFDVGVLWLGVNK